jgi:hypothetical protein
MTTFNKVIQNIIDAHPQSVHQLLLAKGITKPATPEVLLDVYHIYGKPLISELVKITYESKSYDGSTDETEAIKMGLDPNTLTPNTTTDTYNNSVAAGTEQKTLWDNLSKIFDSTANLGTGVSKVISSTKSTVSEIGTTIQNLGSGSNTPAKSGSGNTMLIVGIVVVIVLIIIIFITKRRS